MYSEEFLQKWAKRSGVTTDEFREYLQQLDSRVVSESVQREKRKEAQKRKREEARKKNDQRALRKYINSITKRASYTRSKRSDVVYYQDSKSKYREQIPSAIQKLVWKRDDGMCQYCGESAAAIDHVNPVSLGGTSEPSNLALACQRCNSKLGNKPFASIQEKRSWILSQLG